MFLDPRRVLCPLVRIFVHFSYTSLVTSHLISRGRGTRDADGVVGLGLVGLARCGGVAARSLGRTAQLGRGWVVAAWAERRGSIVKMTRLSTVSGGVLDDALVGRSTDAARAACTPHRHTRTDHCTRTRPAALSTGSPRLPSEGGHRCPPLLQWRRVRRPQHALEHPLHRLLGTSAARGGGEGECRGTPSTPVDAYDL